MIERKKEREVDKEKGGGATPVGNFISNVACSLCLKRDSLEDVASSVCLFPRLRHTLDKDLGLGREEASVKLFSRHASHCANPRRGGHDRGPGGRAAWGSSALACCSYKSD